MNWVNLVNCMKQSESKEFIVQYGQNVNEKTSVETKASILRGGGRCCKDYRPVANQDYGGEKCTFMWVCTQVPPSWWNCAYAVFCIIVDFGGNFLHILVQNCSLCLVQNCAAHQMAGLWAVGELGIRLNRGQFTTSFTSFNHLSSCCTKTATHGSITGLQCTDLQFTAVKIELQCSVTTVLKSVTPFIGCAPQPEVPHTVWHTVGFKHYWRTLGL